MALSVLKAVCRCLLVFLVISNTQKRVHTFPFLWDFPLAPAILHGNSFEVLVMEEFIIRQNRRNRAMQNESQSSGLLGDRSLTEANELVLVTDGSGTLPALKKQLEEFEKKFPAFPLNIVVVLGHLKTDERLAYVMNNYLRQERSGIDVIFIDVIDSGDIGHHLYNLYEQPLINETLLKIYDQDMLQNNIRDNRLVALPLFTDMGLLYYRTDLLSASGFNHPPRTWDELEEMATKIQSDERARRVGTGISGDFWGYTFQGRNYEGWFGSHGVELVSPDGTIMAPNNQNAIKAISRAANWIGTIASPLTTQATEQETALQWLRGNAAFLRTWPYVIKLSQDPIGGCPDSPIPGSSFIGNFSVTALPSYSSDFPRVGALGGWGIAVSRYSAHPVEAVQLVVFLTSEKMQRMRYDLIGSIPTLPHVSSDPSLCYPNGSENADPTAFSICDVEIFPKIEPRPSTVTAPNYIRISNFLSAKVHQVLLGEISPEEAVESISCGVHLIMGKAADKYPKECDCIHLVVHGIAEENFPTQCIKVYSLPIRLIIIGACLLSAIAGVALIAWCKESAKYRAIREHINKQRSMKSMRLQPSVELAKKLREQLILQISFSVAQICNLGTDWLVLINVLKPNPQSDNLNNGFSTPNSEEMNPIWPFVAFIIVISTTHTFYGLRVRSKVLRDVWADWKKGVKTIAQKKEQMQQEISQKQSAGNAIESSESEKFHPISTSAQKKITFQEPQNESQETNLNESKSSVSEPNITFYQSSSVRDRGSSLPNRNRGPSLPAYSTDMQCMSTDSIEAKLARTQRRLLTFRVSLLSLLVEDLPMLVCNLYLLDKNNLSTPIALSICSSLFTIGMQVRGLEIYVALRSEFVQLDSERYAILFQRKLAENIGSNSQSKDPAQVEGLSHRRRNKVAPTVISEDKEYSDIEEPQAGKKLAVAKT